VRPQVYYDSFDIVFFQLAPSLQARVEAEIDRIGARLSSYPHRRPKGSTRFRARVGDYRIIYAFDAERSTIHLLAIGHRREIYRTK
jgi:mRNA interferase RelE/StbE